MRVFLSYPSEHMPLAEQMNAALKAERHDVFFARDSIAAATPFGQAIRAAVRRSDLFLYLVSPESVAAGSYCLTELGFAKEKWPDPAGRVLPVVVAATDPDTFPPYLQGISALVPEGNVAAETVAAVERLERTRRRSFARRHPVLAAGLCLALALGVWGWKRERDAAAARPYLDVGSIVEVRPAVAGGPAMVLVRGNVRNPSPHIDSVTGLDLDLDGSPARATTAGSFVPILLDSAGGSNFEQWYRLSPGGDSLTSPRRFRICVTPGGRSRRVCQPWAEWTDSTLSVLPPRIGKPHCCRHTPTRQAGAPRPRPPLRGVRDSRERGERKPGVDRRSLDHPDRARGLGHHLWSRRRACRTPSCPGRTEPSLRSSVTASGSPRSPPAARSRLRPSPAPAG